MASCAIVSFPCLSSLKKTFKPMAVLSNSAKTVTSYELKKGQNRLYHKLPSGLKMEVIEQRKEKDERRRSEKENPPLVFVHGSYHAAWCWAEHWLSFFSSSGFDSYAISLLGQGGSDDSLGTVAGTLETHASDIANFIESNLSSSPPVLIGHSFGGLIVQYYLANIANKQPLGKAKSQKWLLFYRSSCNNGAYAITGFNYWSYKCISRPFWGCTSLFGATFG